MTRAQVRCSAALLGAAVSIPLAGGACGPGGAAGAVPADAGRDAVYSRRPDGPRASARDAGAGGPASPGGADAAGTTDGAAPAPPADAGPPAPPANPAPWTPRDIGVSGAPASAWTLSTTAFTLRAAGRGAAGAADSVFFLSQKVAGDFELVAKLRSLQMPAPAAQAGFMVRASDSAAGAANLFVVTWGDPAMGGNVQIRETAGGATRALLATNDVNLKPGTFIRIVREGKRLSVYRTANRQSWTRVAVADVDLPAEAFVGVAAAAGRDGALLTTEVDFLKVSNLDADADGRGAMVEDLGTLGGTALLAGGKLTLAGYGQAISATQEFGAFVLRQVSGAQRLTVRVDRLEGPHGQSRLGLMVRDGQPLTMSRSAMHVMVSLTREGGVEFQSRAAQNGTTVFGMKKAGLTPPLWLRLEKVDDATGSAAKLVGSYSTDGVKFETLDSVTLTFPEPFLLGYLANANASGGLAMAHLTVAAASGAPPAPADAGAAADARAGH